LLQALPIKTAFAQEYPSRPIRVIVPTATGTATDACTRYLARALQSDLNQQVIVENKPGGDGVIATDFVHRSPADGYTLLSSFASHYIHQWVGKVSFDAVNDFVPIIRYGATAVVLAVASNSPFRSLRELIDAAQKNPDQLTYASAASTSTMCAALLESMAGVKLRLVPYKSSPQSVIDAASGMVNMTFAGVAAALPLVQSGRVRILAVSTPRRWYNLPEVPTMDEGGVAGFDLAVPTWIFAPRGTPSPVILKLSETLTRAASSTEFRDFARNTGLDVDVQGHQVAQAAGPAELAKWGRLVSLAKLSPT
jgi:tripartite-type tricarboxylate transporter receptor subunit TctC